MDRNWAFPMAQQVKTLPAMQETKEMQVRSLGREDPLEEAMATYSSTLAWRIPWTEEPGWLQSIGSQRAGHDLKALIFWRRWRFETDAKKSFRL